MATLGEDPYDVPQKSLSDLVSRALPETGYAGDEQSTVGEKLTAPQWVKDLNQLGQSSGVRFGIPVPPEESKQPAPSSNGVSGVVSNKPFTETPKLAAPAPTTPATAATSQPDIASLPGGNIAGAMAERDITQRGAGGAPGAPGVAPTVQVIKGTNVRNEVPLDYQGMQMPGGAVMSGTPMVREPSRPNVMSDTNMAIYNKRMDSYKQQTQNLADIEKTRLAGEFGLQSEALKGKNAADLADKQFRTAHMQDKELGRRWNAKSGESLAKSQYLMSKEGEFHSPHHQELARQVQSMAVEDPKGAEAYLMQNIKQANILGGLDRAAVSKDPAEQGHWMKTYEGIVQKVGNPAYSGAIQSILKQPGVNPLKTKLVMGYAGDQQAWNEAVQSLGTMR